MNDRLTDADLIDKVRRNLRRIIGDAGRHALELETGRFGAELQPDRGRSALGEVAAAGERLLRNLGDDAGG
jgi:hypothetical protein